jgi:hypothetical protein
MLVGRWSACVTVFVALALVGLAGCAGQASSPPAVRVGDTTIAKRSVDHWASTITRGAFVPNLTSDPSEQSPKQQALTVLIASAWVNDEAARVGLRPSRGEIARMVQAQERGSPDGSAGFAQALKESGQTLADVEAEARARWSAEALDRHFGAIAERAAKAQVSDRDVSDYYRRHIAKYHLRERRYYALLERIPSKAEAAAKAKQIRISKHFPAQYSKERPYRPRSFAGLPGQAVVYRAVFAAKKTGVVVGPLPLQGAWSLFMLKRIVPARLQPFSEVAHAIEKQLLDVARRKATAQLISAFRQKWIAMTDCQPGYVVQKCKQFAGTRVPELPPFVRF